MLPVLKHSQHKHVHGYEEHCHDCNFGKEQGERTKAANLNYRKHLDSGEDQCRDHSCDITVPHGHVHHAKHKHRDVHAHEPHTEQLHDHSTCHHQHHNTESKPKPPKHSLWLVPLEKLIPKLKLPQWIQQFILNTSFLSPALISNKLLEKLPIPEFIKTWISITTMHGLNRGKHKLGRLALTYATTAATHADKALYKYTKGAIGVDARLARFIATTGVAIIEKFSGQKHDNHGHNHDHEHFHDHECGIKQKDLISVLKSELKIFRQNIFKAKLWKEFLPSLLAIETKVQVISPLVNKFVAKTINPQKQKKLQTLSQILLTSSGFVGFDQILKSLGAIFGQDSVFASAVSAICGCCGSPVCAAAATDTAMSSTVFNN